jgi:hypothetical protein
MCNDRIKTILTRRAIQWEEFLQEIINKVEENGYQNKLFKPELERLILRHASIQVVKNDIINGFSGVNKVNKEVESWMKGKPISVVR